LVVKFYKQKKKKKKSLPKTTNIFEPWTTHNFFFNK
jgi:hypothetical protein